MSATATAISTETRTTITVSIQGCIELEVEQVWPDGDAPRGVTAAAVKAAMERSGCKIDVLDEWGFTPDIEVHVDVVRRNPLAGQMRFDETVEPDLLTSDAEVWS